jgi:hypothetical protein
MGSVQEIPKFFSLCSPAEISSHFYSFYKTLKTLAHTSLHTKLAELLQPMHPAYELHVI